jgi:hypothetical protein
MEEAIKTQEASDSSNTAHVAMICRVVGCSGRRASSSG